MRVVAPPSFVVVDPDDLPELPDLPKVDLKRSIQRTKPRSGVPRSVLVQRRQVRDQDRRRKGLAIEVANPDTAPDVIPDADIATSDDLAAVVVRKTRSLLAQGKLQPTLRDGLSAQQLLDRRAEKAADRQFMLNLAMAMAGGGYQPPQKLLPEGDDVIEGEFADMDLAPEHLRQG